MENSRITQFVIAYILIDLNEDLKETKKKTLIIEPTK